MTLYSIMAQAMVNYYEKLSQIRVGKINYLSRLCSFSLDETRGYNPRVFLLLRVKDVDGKKC